MNWNDNVKIAIGFVLGCVLTATLLALGQSTGMTFDLDTMGKLGAVLVPPFTLGLVAFTGLLARETRHMWIQNRMPHVIITIEPSRRSLMYVDIVIENVGAGPAFDIKVTFDPDAEITFERRHFRLSSLAIVHPPTLKPRQQIISFLGPWSGMTPRRVRAKIRCFDGDRREHEFTNEIDLDSYKGLEQLGEPPIQELADEIKKISRSIEALARGNNRLEVNTHTNKDRTLEEAELRRRIEELTQRQKPKEPPTSS